MELSPMESLIIYLLIQTMGPEGGCGYGGVDMCIKCKEKGLDKYVDVNGLEKSYCNICFNNITAMKMK